MLNAQKGFTLLEGIIAMTVITVGLVAGMSLAISNISTAQNNERRVVAVNLAREGVEAIRNMRDSNWLKVDLNRTYSSDAGGGKQLYSWDSFLSNQGSWYASAGRVFTMTLIPGTNPSYNLTPYDTGADCGNNDYMCGCMADQSCPINYDPATHFYGTSVGAATAFHRIITLQDICYVDSNSTEVIMEPIDGCGSVSGANPDRVGIVVTSQVRYPVGRSTQDEITRERLYNWR